MMSHLFLPKLLEGLQLDSSKLIWLTYASAFKFKQRFKPKLVE